MGALVLVPAGTNSNNFPITGGGTAHAALVSNGDSKYVSAPTGAASLSLSTTVGVVPEGAVVYRLMVSRGGGAIFGNGLRVFSMTGGFSSGGVSGNSTSAAVSHQSGLLSIPGPISIAGAISLTAPADASSGMTIDSMSLTVYYNRAPSAPINLSPAEGSVTQELAPNFSGTRVDADGDSMDAVDIEVRRVSNNQLMWASGWLTVSPQAATFSKAYAGSALIEGVQYKWRARTRDGSGASNAEGAWSAYVTFTANENDAPTATQVSPAADAQPGDLTPDFTFGWSDPDPGDQFTTYQLGVRRKSDSVTFWTSDQKATTAAEKTARQATATYNFDGDATALVSGIEYQWRVRVQDAYGLWSPYTGWRDFTPSLKPNPPLLTSPIDTAAGATNTLTPTISGTYQQAAGAAEAGYQYEIRSGLTTIYASGDVAGAFGSGQAYGTANPADTPSTPPALAWGQTYTIRARSKDAIAAYSDWTAWRTFRTNAAPLSPLSLSPGNGQLVNDTTPDIAWQHIDPDGDAQTAVDIEIYDVTAGAFVSGYGPKSLSQSAQAHTVSGVSLIDPHQYQLRIRTTGLAGPGAGAWSAPVVWTVANAVIMAITTPSVGGVATASNLAVVWSFTGGSGVQANYRVRLYASDGSTLLYDSGVIASALLTHTIPSGVIHNGEAYYVQVTGEDTLGLDGASAQVPFIAVFTPPASVTGLAAVAIGGRS